jgi:tetratricopeptide (TPR) repeat protein
MKWSFHGTLTEQPVAKLIGEIANLHLTGLLRLLRDDSAKAIYFESGAPVFAASDNPSEQLEHKLLLSGLVPAELIDEARRRSLTPQALGWNLVDVGALSQSAMEQSVRELATEIILSVFEWEQGDYTFYEDSQLDLEVKLDWRPAEFILVGARRAAKRESVAAAIAPAKARLIQCNAGPDSIGGAATLNSSEAFVLSSIATSTTVDEISTLTGLSESESRSAICVLVALGLLRLEAQNKGTEGDGQKLPDEPKSRAAEKSACRSSNGDESGGTSVERVLERISRQLSSIASANYYGILGIERIAPAGSITSAYQEMKQSVDLLRSRWPDHEELTQALDSLIGKIDEAYETLRDPVKRTAYDWPLSGGPGGTKAPKKSNATRSVARRTAAPISVSHPLSAPSPVSFNLKGKPAAQMTIMGARQVPDALALAEEHYRRGRARFDRSDFHGAEYLFRLALKLDPSQSRYYFYLGVTLSMLAQARHSRHSHTHDTGCHVNCTLGGALARNPRLRHEAEQHMLKAAELDRSNPEIRLRLARLYQDSGMEKKAGHYFLETLMLDASNPIALRELGIG